MSREQLWVVAGGVVALTLLLVALALLTVARLRAEVRELRGALADKQMRAGSDPGSVPGSAQQATYVITALPDEPRPARAEALAEPIDGRLFADIVVRETAVRAGGLVHGLRRALAPEVRNRIRFEMRRELKRSRKQRRIDTRSALRDFHARERDRLSDVSEAGDAA